MIPLLMSPVSTARSIEPAARTRLIARMWRPWPPSVGCPVLVMPSVVPKIAASMSCTATALPASTACT